MFFALLASLVLLFATASQSSATESIANEGAFSFAGTKNVLLLLDCSDSMDKHFGKATVLVSRLIANMPDDVNCGLRVFGGKGGIDPVQQCQSTELMRPLEPHPRQVLKLLRTLRPAGETSPLTTALQQAIEKDLSEVKGKSVVVLISSIGEDTCTKDPCKYASELRKRGLTTPIVAISMQKMSTWDRSTNILDTISKETNGKYYSWTSHESLIEDFVRIKQR